MAEEAGESATTFLPKSVASGFTASIKLKDPNSPAHGGQIQDI
jgi:hypothetical protein